MLILGNISIAKLTLVNLPRNIVSWQNSYATETLREILQLGRKNFYYRTTIQQWRSQVMHGRYRVIIAGDNIDNDEFSAYLQYSNLFMETNGLLSSIRNNVIATRYYKISNLKEQVQQTRCLLCNQLDGCWMFCLSPKILLRVKIYHQYKNHSIYVLNRLRSSQIYFLIHANDQFRRSFYFLFLMKFLPKVLSQYSINSVCRLFSYK